MTPVEAGELAGAICRTAHPPGSCSERIAAVLTAYLDDSGSYPANTYVAIAGAIGPEVEWAHLTIEWQQVIQSKGVRVFHRSDCQALEGEFKGWTASDRDSLVEQLIDLFLAHRQLWGIGAFVSRRDYHEYVPYELRKAVGKPYLMCLEASFHRVDGTTLSKEEKIGVVFERSDEYVGKARELYYKLVKKPQWKDRLLSFTDAPKEQFTPLQVADLMAWELRNHCHSVWHTYGATPPGFQKLYDSNRCRFAEFDRDGIHRLLGELASAGKIPAQPSRLA